MQFQQWLARPSTIRLLRIILDQPGHSSCPIKSTLRKRCQSTEVALREAISLSNETNEHVKPHPLPAPTDTSSHSHCSQQRYGQATSQRPDRKTTHTLTIPDDIEGETKKLAHLLETQKKEGDIEGLRKVLIDFLAQDIAISQTGPSAEKVWSILLSSISEHSRGATFIRSRLFRYAARLKRATGYVAPHLHRTIIGQLLRNDPYTGQIREYHVKFKAYRMCSVRDLVELVDDVLESKLPDVAFKQWSRLYMDGRARDISSACLSRVSRDNKLYDEFVALFHWEDNSREHDYQSATEQIHGTKAPTIVEAQQVITKTEGLEPSDAIPIEEEHEERKAAVTPSVIQSDLSWSVDLLESNPIDRQNDTKDPLVRSVSQQGSRYARQKPEIGPQYTREAMSVMLGEVHGVKEKTIDDYLAARMLATWFLPLQATITVLHVLGVKKLGSIAIQEIAQRAGTAEQIQYMLKHAQTQGLDLVDSTYLRLLQTLATHDATALSTLLHSDQHPDNFDDLALQTRLLADFERANDQANIVLTLEVLRIHNHVSPDMSWNVSLRAAAASKNIAEVRHLLEHIKLNRIQISEETLHKVNVALLPPRGRSKREMHDTNTTIHRLLLTNVYMQCTEAGVSIPARWWLELFKRFGMSHQVRHLNKLAIWMGSRIGQESAKLYPTVPIFSKIFTHEMQKAIVRWAWTAAGLADRLTRSQNGGDRWWAAGIVTLKRLHDAGLPVSTLCVKIAIAQQLRTLYGPHRSVRMVNHIIVRNNRLSVVDYLKQIEMIWPDLMGNKEDRNALLSWMSDRRRLRSRGYRPTTFRRVELVYSDGG